MVGLDTNVLLRWLLDDSIAADDAPEQSEIVSKALLAPGAKFFVNDIVLAETIWVLRNKVGQRKAIIVEVIDRLMASSNIEVENRLTIEKAKAAFVIGRGDFADELIAGINQAAGCTTTLTFDRKAAHSPLFTALAT